MDRHVGSNHPFIVLTKAKLSVPHIIGYAPGFLQGQHRDDPDLFLLSVMMDNTPNPVVLSYETEDERNQDETALDVALLGRKQDVS